MASLPDHLSPKPAGQQRLPREVMEAHQRENFVMAAAQVFTQLGYSQTTVDDLVIGGRAGVGTFYKLFEGKEDCFLRCLEWVVASALDIVSVQGAEEGDWGPQVAAFLKQLVGLIETDQVSARLVLVEAPTAGPVAVRRCEELLEEAEDFLRRGRKYTRASSTLPQTLEIGIVGGSAWLLREKIVKPRKGSIEGLFPELASIALSPYVGDKVTEKLIAAANDGQD